MILQVIYSCSIVALLVCNARISARAANMEKALRQATHAMHSAIDRFHDFVRRDKDGAALAARELVEAMRGLETQEISADKELEG